MAIYFCRWGDIKETGLIERGAFTVTDKRGRTWVCREGTQEEANDGSGFDVFSEMATQQRAFAQGLTEGGSGMSQVTCDLDELPEVLSRK